MTAEQVIEKYCNRCIHKEKCHNLCITVNRALLGLEEMTR